MNDEQDRQLRAGPVRLELANGELRYLRVNGREVLRRAYFGVRDARWGTAPATIEQMDLNNSGEEFTAELRVRCRNEIADFAWNGRIEGRRDGSIRFTIEGKALTDFESPRIGFCVLFGAEAFAGQAYELVKADGGHERKTFPRFISPHQIAQRFTSLSVTTREEVRVVVAVPGTQMDMEDQRNYGDSSYKAFIEGTAFSSQRLDIAVDTSSTEVLPEEPPAAPITIGDPGEARLPRLTRTDTTTATHPYTHYNRNREAFADAATIDLAFNPGVHLADDEALMENLSAIVDQAATIRTFAPTATLHAAPVLFDAPHPSATRDPRNGTAFATAWLARFVKFAAHAGIVEAGIALADGPWTVLYEALSALAGSRLLRTGTDPHAAVDVLAVERGSIWVVNYSSRSRTATVQSRDREHVLVLEPYEVRLLPAVADA